MFLLETQASVSAADAVVESEAFESLVRPFFAKHCNDCHGDGGESDLRLDTLKPNFVDREPSGHWVEVLDRINLGEMPPEDQPRPDARELAKVTTWITANIQNMQRRAESTDGRVVMRRLSRLEYANTVRDLFAVRLCRRVKGRWRSFRQTAVFRDLTD